MCAAPPGKTLCHRCHQIVIGDYFNVNAQYYHKMCFKCEKCWTPLTKVRLTLILHIVFILVLVFRGIILWMVKRFAKIVIELRKALALGRHVKVVNNQSLLANA